MPEVIFPKSKKITIADKEFEIKKLPFKKLVEVRALAFNIDLDNPETMVASADNIIKFLVIAIGADKEFLEEKLYAEDMIRIVKEVLEVNKVPLEEPQAPGAEPTKKE